MSKVILKPCELHTKKNREGVLCIFAGLWDITSSDMKTHSIFCDVMKKYKVFYFGNAGKCLNKGKPYTFDDGGESVSWLQNMASAIVFLRSRDIDVVIELSKKLCMEYGVNENYEVDYADSTSDTLISIYFAGLVKVFQVCRLYIIKTKCTNLGAYSQYVVISNDRIGVSSGVANIKYSKRK